MNVSKFELLDKVFRLQKSLLLDELTHLEGKSLEQKSSWESKTFSRLNALQQNLKKRSALSPKGILFFYNKFQFYIYVTITYIYMCVYI